MLAFVTKRNRDGDDKDGGSDPKRAKAEEPSPQKKPGSALEISAASRKQAITRLLAPDGLTGIEQKHMGADWFELLKPQFAKAYFEEIKIRLARDRKKAEVYPPAHQIYSFTKYPFKGIKVVILGQDPYHDSGQAHGLSFSVVKGTRIPPSLVNMYKELSTDIEGFQAPKHGFLEGWARQGVLLLNASLTVEAHKAASHSSIGWAELTDAIVDLINSELENVVFMLWGRHAQKKGSRINRQRHLVLQAAHPSPLSANRGFFGCKHFSIANKYLEGKSRTPIDWNHLP